MRERITSIERVGKALELFGYLATRALMARGVAEKVAESTVVGYVRAGIKVAQAQEETDED